MKNSSFFLLVTGAFTPFSIFAQKMPSPNEWGEFGGKPSWPPRYKTGAPVPDEVPLDSYDILLFLAGLVLVYVLWQKANGASWKEIVFFSNAYSFLASKI